MQKKISLLILSGHLSDTDIIMTVCVLSWCNINICTKIYSWDLCMHDGIRARFVRLLGDSVLV